MPQTAFLTAPQPPLAPSFVEPSRERLLAEVSRHADLGPASRSDKRMIHVVLRFAETKLAYEPGDALDIYPRNDDALVERVLAATGLSGESALRTLLMDERDMTALSHATVERFVMVTGHPEARKLISSDHARAWIEGRQFIDLLERFPVSLTSQQLAVLTAPLRPRAYSIASSRKEVGNEAHLLVSAARNEVTGKTTGIASAYLADRVAVASRITVRLRPNSDFRLPGPSTDIIMIGAGTGIAPFRAFLQERSATRAPGRNWLVFGTRHEEQDFPFRSEWRDALKDGSLHRLDLAFSGDGPNKGYVQDRLWASRGEIVRWLKGGASLYVCGDAKGMARDVRAILVRLFADVGAMSQDLAETAVSNLEREGRYRQDVY